MKLKCFTAGLVILLYFLPCFIQFDFDKSYHIDGIQINWPKLLSGDIPHYFVVASSLIQDLDFNVRNNYQNSLEGGFDAGVKFQSKELAPQSRYFDKFKSKWYISWHFFYEPYQTQLKSIDRTTLEEYSVHPPALSILMSILFWPLNNSRFVEILAIFTSICFALAGLFLLFKIFLYYSKNEKISLFITFIVAFGSPWWHYASSFAEVSFIGALLIMAYYFFIIKKQSFFPGLLLALATSIKYSFGIFIILFALKRLIEKKVDKFIIFLIPSIIFGLVVLYYNVAIFGNLNVAQRYYFTEWGNPIISLAGILFSPTQGLLFFCPFILFSLLGFKSFKEKYKADAYFVLIITIIYYLVWGIKGGINWTGGAYSNRYLIPIIPILAIPILFWYCQNQQKRFWKRCFWILIFVSILINLQAALFPALFLAKPPWELITLVLTKFTKILLLMGFD